MKRIHLFLGVARPLAPLLVAAAWLASPGPARAALILNVGSVAVGPGSAGNALDVTLTNTNASAVTLAGFSFGLSTASPGVVFTSVTTGTAAPYLFAGHSGTLLLLGLPSIDTTTGASVVASDFFDVAASGAILGVGQTVGLGRVFFDVGAVPAGSVIATTVDPFPTTGLNDPLGGDVPIDVRVGGTITIAPGVAVPGPSSLALCGLAGLTLLGRARSALRRAPGRG